MSLRQAQGPLGDCRLRDRGGVLRDRSRSTVPEPVEGTFEESVVIYLYKWVLITRVVGRNMGIWGVGVSFGPFS